MSGAGILAINTKFESNGTRYIVKEQFVKNGITHQVRQVLGSTKKKTVKYSADGKYIGKKNRLFSLLSRKITPNIDTSSRSERADLA